MENNYALNDALNYAETIIKMENFDRFDYVPFNKAIKFFADSGDKDNFKRIVDKYIQLVENHSKDKILKNSFSFLEFLCSGMDHGFTNTWLSNKRNEKLEPGNTQKLFREIYSIGE